MAVFNSQSVKRNNPATMDSQVAEKDYYIDKDGNLVDEGDANAAFLVAGKGTEIPKDVAEKYGITVGDSEDQEKAEAPKANKLASPAKNKGANK